MVRFKEIIFLFFLLYNCSTSQIEEVKFYPSPSVGCSSYIGKERISCINELLKDLETITNSPPKIEIISKIRKNESIVVIKKKYSHGNRISWESESEVIDRTFWSEVKHTILIILPSSAFGFILALSL